MPIILENSHSHQFTFVTEDGVTKNVEVQRGQDIENLGIPLKTLQKLMAEFVITFKGNAERPRYKYVEEMPEAKPTYTSGPITQALVTKSLRREDEEPDGERLSPSELAKRQREAEAAMEAEARASLTETVELKNAEMERVEREAAEASERATAAEARMAEMEAQLAAAQKSAATATPTTTKATKPGKPANK